MPGYDAYPPPPAQYMHQMYDPNAYSYQRYPPYGPGPMMPNNMGYMNYNHYYPNMYGPEQGMPMGNMGQGMPSMGPNMPSKQSMPTSMPPVVHTSQPPEPYYAASTYQMAQPTN